ncbi:MAG: type II toxin-antitoxin system VapC family toxin [Candidatus Micrarchaeales archaeon]|nr:type II toxin-antitoxin system VapC family toxin [Candidatus Micrarchaeales archaeon]
MICLDTGVIIRLMRSDTKTQEAVEKYAGPEGEISITAITLYELLKNVGMKTFERVSEFLKDVEIYQFDEKAAVIASELYKELEKNGKLINENDILIAGTAIAKGQLLLATDGDFSNLHNSKIIVL